MTEGCRSRRGKGVEHGDGMAMSSVICTASFCGGGLLVVGGVSLGRCRGGKASEMGYYDISLGSIPSMTIDCD